MSIRKGNPPPNWAASDATRFVDVGGDIYVQFPVGERRGNPMPVFWHFCTASRLPASRWIARSIGKAHTFVSKEPLTITPSLLCGEEGCSTHGFITNDRWIPV